MIDIIIPAYNAHFTIGKTLGSIAKQINRSSLKVYIINDGSSKDYGEIISNYDGLLDIKEIYIENSGPGVARQIGIDVSNNEYIVFIDADDELYDEYSLLNLVNIIPEADLAQGAFIEEGENGIVNREPQYCYLHGKMYRRSIINKYSLRFDETRRYEGDIYEDSTFNQLYSICCKNIASTNEIVYKYKYNSNSITRFNKSTSGHLKNFVNAMTWLMNEIEKIDTNNYHEIAWHCCVVSFHCYFNYMISEEESGFVFEDMKKIKEMYNKYINNLPYDEQLTIYHFFDHYQIIPTISFYDFMNRVK